MAEKVATGSAVISAFEEALVAARKSLEKIQRRDAGIVVESGGERKFRVFVDVVEITDDTVKVVKKKVK